MLSNTLWEDLAEHVVGEGLTSSDLDRFHLCFREGSSFTSIADDLNGAGVTCSRKYLEKIQEVLRKHLMDASEG